MTEVTGRVGRHDQSECLRGMKRRQNIENELDPHVEG